MVAICFQMIIEVPDPASQVSGVKTLATCIPLVQHARIHNGFMDDPVSALPRLEFAVRDTYASLHAGIIAHSDLHHRVTMGYMSPSGEVISKQMATKILISTQTGDQISFMPYFII